MERNGLVIRLAVESHMGRTHFDDFETFEEMCDSVTYLQAKSMKQTLEDGVERMVGFVVSKKDTNPENN